MPAAPSSTRGCLLSDSIQHIVADNRFVVFLYLSNQFYNSDTLAILQSHLNHRHGIIVGVHQYGADATISGRLRVSDRGNADGVGSGFATVGTGREL